MVGTLLQNPWVQSIGGSSIAALVISLLVFAVKRRREALFTIGVSTVIFAFGFILEPAVKYVLEGPEGVKDLFLLNEGIRQQSPELFIACWLLNGLIPGISTGLFILKARSFRQRVGYGAFWAAVSLILYDLTAYYFVARSIKYEKIASLPNIYFSFISDIFGGAVGGVIIGSLFHLYREAPQAQPRAIPRRRPRG